MAAALLWGGPSVPDCTKCSAPVSQVERAQMAELWGCDGEACATVFVVACPDCAGRERDCPTCSGTGEKPYLRCPGRIMQAAGVEAAYAREAVRAWQQYDARHALPIAGGYLDQTAHFTQVCDLLDAERAFHDGREEARRSD